MAPYRVRRRPITRSDGEVFEPGDEIDPTEAELRAFGDNIKEIEDAEDDPVDKRALELADENYQTATSAVKDGDADEFLDDLVEVDDRSSVQDAIEERRAELEED